MPRTVRIMCKQDYDIALRNKKQPFYGLHCSGGFPDLFLVVLTNNNLFLRLLYELSFKSIKFPKKINLAVLKLFF